MNQQLVARRLCKSLTLFKRSARMSYAGSGIHEPTAFSFPWMTVVCEERLTRYQFDYRTGLRHKHYISLTIKSSETLQDAGIVTILKLIIAIYFFDRKIYLQTFSILYNNERRLHPLQSRYQLINIIVCIIGQTMPSFCSESETNE